MSDDQEVDNWFSMPRGGSGGGPSQPLNTPSTVTYPPTQTAIPTQNPRLAPLQPGMVGLQGLPKQVGNLPQAGSGLSNVTMIGSNMAARSSNIAGVARVVQPTNSGLAGMASALPHAVNQPATSAPILAGGLPSSIPQQGLSKMTAATTVRPPVTTGPQPVTTAPRPATYAGVPQPLSTSHVKTESTYTASSVQSNIGPPISGAPPAKKQMIADGINKPRNADGSAMNNEDEDENIIAREAERSVINEPIKYGMSRLNPEDAAQEKKKDELRRISNSRVVAWKAKMACDRNRMVMGKNVAEALSLAVQQRIENVLQEVVKLSKRRIDPEKDRMPFVVSSNPRLFFSDAEKAQKEAREQRLMEKKAMEAGASDVLMAVSQAKKQEEDTGKTALGLARMSARTPTITSASLYQQEGLGGLGGMGGSLSSNFPIQNLSAQAQSIKDRQRRITSSDMILFLLSDPRTKHIPLTMNTMAGIKPPESESMPLDVYRVSTASSQLSQATQLRNAVSNASMASANTQQKPMPSTPSNVATSSLSSPSLAATSLNMAQRTAASQNSPQFSNAKPTASIQRTATAAPGTTTFNTSAQTAPSYNPSLVKPAPVPVAKAVSSVPTAAPTVSNPALAKPTVSAKPTAKKA